MRVLAVRGRNLASLEGDWAVDFEAEPLASAGIFAITGPTGAGKSTLLDAMCLALFNTLPRVGSAGTASIGAEGAEAIGARDTRAVLRHGAGEGFAEIDFIGVDGHRYRARWTVRRAHGKALGALQNVTQECQNLDTGDRLGGTRTETLAAIGSKVGLTAEQFTRAVMLAQGEFDAFVRADANERAVLLERLTGSAIYARIGRAAFEKARALEAEITQLQTRIADHQGLDDAARAGAEARLADARAAHEAVLAQLGELQAARGWEETRDALARKVSACEEALGEAQEAREAAAPRREALRRDWEASAYVAEWQAKREAAARASAGAETVTRLEADLVGAEATLDAAALAEGKAQDALDEAEAHARALAPEIEQARRLDREIAETQDALADASVARKKRADEVDEAEAAYGRARADLGQAVADRDANAAWLRDHAAVADLAFREAELVADLDEYRTLAEQLEQLTATFADAKTRADAAGRDHEAAQVAFEEARAASEASAVALAKATAAAPDTQRLAAAEDRRSGLIRAGALIGEVAVRRERLGEAEASAAASARERADVAERIAATAARREALAAELPALAARHEEAGRALALSAAAADEAADQLRATLIEGEPCPVCGSAEHPLHALRTLVGERLDADRARADALGREHQAAMSEAAVLTDREAADRQRAARIESAARAAGTQLETARSALHTARDALRQAMVVLGGNPALEDDGQREWLAAASEDAEEERRHLQALADALDHARTAEAARRQAFEAAREGLLAAERAVTAASQVRDGLTAKRDGAVATLDRLGRALDDRLGRHLDWRVEHDPAARVAALAGEWRRRSAARDAAEALIPAATEAGHAADLARQAAATALAGARHAADNCEATLTVRRAERAGLLDGESTAAVADRVEAELATRRDTLEMARSERSRAAAEQAGAVASLAQARAQQARDEADAIRRGDELAARLAALSLTEAAVAEVAGRGNAAIEAEAAALGEIESRVRDAAVSLDARREDAAAHAAGGEPGLLGSDLADALTSAEAEETVAREALGQAAFAIQQDDAARGRTAALRAELSALSAQADVWLRLSALIGDREGARFRRFAQGLTLDRLLGHANERLAELKPRYALERGQGGDMLIQVVDHDMGGEVRGLHNLSGGERFLVSLALALGLSEMSTTRGLAIESLFIDEGFGALDGQSLGAAIAMLEQLHATGRRVGVISHIEEVKERIPVKIEVTPIARGRSEIAVVAG